MKKLLRQRLKQGVVILSLFLFAIGSMPLAMMSSAYAQENPEPQTNCDTDFYSSNTILFYNPCTSVCSSGVGDVSSPVTLTGKDNREKTFNFWLSKGLSPKQAVGITASLEKEGGHSPFRQEIGKAWPTYGWGIAQFTFGQRDAATESVRKEIGEEMFNSYYKPEFGGGVSQEKGFVPDGVPLEVNDKFLLAELNYLFNYTSGFAPSTIATRVNLLRDHYGQTVGSGVKLMDYLKSLESANDVAIAWTYLYEFPGGIRDTAKARGELAESLNSTLTGGGTSETNCNTVGMGGLDYEQSLKLMKHYLVHRNDNGDLGSYGASNLIYQCTALSYWFTTKFEAGSYHGNGGDVADNLLRGSPNGYTRATRDTIKPYTIYSIKGIAEGYGHTGVILGVGEDGSIVVGESNVRENAISQGAKGLNNFEYIHDEANNWRAGRRAGLYVSHWQSVADWEAYWKGSGYVYAAPTDNATTAQKVQAHMNGI